MGCDIHLFVEKKGVKVWEEVKFSEPFYNNRNYYLFSILADVRNGSGFVPIAEPRGLPDDVNSKIKKEFISWGEDAHSQSYFTVKELLDFDWCQKIVHEGQVAGPIYAKWKFQGKYGESYPAPSEYCESASGSRVQHVTDAEMIKIIKQIQGDRTFWEAQKDLENKLWSTYTKACWESTYYQNAGDWWSMTMPRLLALCNGDFDSVRIVFWFDN